MFYFIHRYTFKLSPRDSTTTFRVLELNVSLLQVRPTQSESRTSIEMALNVGKPTFAWSRLAAFGGCGFILACTIIFDEPWPCTAEYLAKLGQVWSHRFTVYCLCVHAWPSLRQLGRTIYGPWSSLAHVWRFYKQSLTEIDRERPRMGPQYPDFRLS